MSFFRELNRRNVTRVAVAYLVSAWLIIQVAETIFPLFGFTETPARIVVIVVACGFIPALILAWVFELTPEGLRRDRSLDRSKPDLRESHKPFDRIVMAVLALALAFFAIERFVLVPVRTASEVEQARQEARSGAFVESFGDLSIAVLAFEDMSPESDQEYLSDGIAEEILNLLARIPEIRVISRSSAFSFKGKDVQVPEIAAQLNVAHVLEGSVRTSGKNLRITAQLIDARSDTHIWSESYDRELGDILAVQEDVASRIVAELEPALLGDVPQAQQIAADTYYRYLRGKFHLESGEVAQAITTLKKVVEEEPRFADGWAQLALAYFYSSPSRLLRDHSNDPNWDKLLATTEKVAEIDPDHPAVLIGDAWLAIERRRDYEFAAGNLELAVERYSDPEMVLRPAAHFATMIGRGDLALKFLRLAQDRDPLCGVCVYQFANTLMQFGQYGKAEQAILDWAALVNADGGGELTLGKARLLAGDLDSAEAAFDRRQDPPGRLYGQLAIRIARGENGGVQQDIAAFAGLNSYLGSIAVAELYAMSGNDDAAFEWLRKIADVNVSWVLATDLKSPFLAGLGDDPRWVELQEIAGIAPRQLEGLDFDPHITWSEDR